MTSTLLKLLLTATALLALTACAGDDDKKGDPEYGQEVGPHWSVNEVSLRCENDSICPDNSGVLLVVVRSTESTYYGTTYKLNVARCTATIYDTNKVITAGHCVDRFNSASEIWFKTAEKPGRPSRTFRVSSNVLKVDWSSSDLWKADYAAIELQSPATGITFARPPLQLPANTTDMIALVVNAVNSYSNYDLKLSANKCVNKAEDAMPMSYDQHPDKFLVVGCKAVSGNSGGAVVAANDYNSVLGIVSAGPKDPNKSSSFEDLFARLRSTSRAKKLYSDENFGIITNARCVSLPGWPQAQTGCTVMSYDKVIKIAAEGMSKKAVASMRERVGAWLDSEQSKTRGAGAEVKFAPEPTPYKKSSILSTTSFGYAFMPVPLCVETNPKFANDKATDFYLRVALYAIEGENPSDRIAVSGSYKRLANGNYSVSYKYFATYEHSGIEFNYPDKSVFKKLAKMDQTTEIGPCKGTEREDVVSLFRDKPNSL